MIEGDRRLKICELTAHVGISYGSVQSIISDDLGYRKCRVPRLLMEDQKANRLVACERLGTISNSDFLRLIVTCNETWVDHYIQESEQASWEWWELVEASPWKVKPRLSSEKVLATLFCDCRGILLVDFLHEWSTVNAAYYCQLLDEVKLTYRRKRRDMPIQTAILLYGNARPRTAALTQKKLDKIHWKVQEHPTYIPCWRQMIDFEINANFESPFGGWWRSWRKKMLHRHSRNRS